MGSFSSALFILGITFIYGAVGTLELKEIMVLLQNNYGISYDLVFISFFFLLIGLLTKLGSVPFHY